MTKTSQAPSMQKFRFCPGCGAKHPSSREEDMADCCNPKCQGEWGTGCYHCHHPAFWPSPLFVVTATLKSKKSKRMIQSYVKANGPGDAVVKFTEKLQNVLLVRHGSRWHITVCQSVIGSPGDFGSILCAYDHYAKGATVYHDPTTEPPPEEPKPKPEPMLKEEPVTDKPTITQLPKKMTREQALEALRTYVSQQVEYETLSIIDMIVCALANDPGAQTDPGRRVEIKVGACPVDYPYNEILQHARALNLGKLAAPSWIERFQKLIKEIREEFDLHERVATPMPGSTGLD